MSPKNNSHHGGHLKYNLNSLAGRYFKFSFKLTVLSLNFLGFTVNTEQYDLCSMRTTVNKLIG